MKKRLSSSLFPVIALILEILPLGAVLNFSPDGIETVRKTYSYFNPLLIGYANFPPFLTAIVTCVLFALSLSLPYTNNPRVLIAARITACVGVVLSLCPILYGLNFYSLVGALITATLIAEAVRLFITEKKSTAIN